MRKSTKPLGAVAVAGTELSILVAYASRHGATEDIAERIAEGLRAAGWQADVRPVQEVGNLADYWGIVIGSATYSTHWLKNATAFVRSNQALLAQRPVWLFSSGPLGAEATDARAVDLSAAFEPTEIRGFQAAIHPQDHRIFFGALDPGRLSPGELSCLKRPATRAILPEGDFRDWTQIEEWAEGIARELTQLDATRADTEYARARDEMLATTMPATLPLSHAQNQDRIGRIDLRACRRPTVARRDTPCHAFLLSPEEAAVLSARWARAAWQVT